MNNLNLNTDSTITINTIIDNFVVSYDTCIGDLIEKEYNPLITSQSTSIKTLFAEVFQANNTSNLVNLSKVLTKYFQTAVEIQFIFANLPFKTLCCSCCLIKNLTLL